MVISRLTEFFKPHDGVQPLDENLQHYITSGKRPFEEIKRLIKKEQKKVTELKKGNKIAADFWTDNFTQAEEEHYLNSQDLTRREITKWKKFYGIRKNGSIHRPDRGDHTAGDLGL